MGAKIIDEFCPLAILTREAVLARSNPSHSAAAVRGHNKK
jgi:hypothetical protein